MDIRSLFEMPIQKLELVGDFSRASSFRHADDRKLLTNPKAVKKIKGMWKFPEETDYNIIVVNHPDGRKWSEVGEVQTEWLRENMPRVWDQIDPFLDMHSVNIIYTNNSAGERVPMTGWIMAHRFGHALSARLASKSYFMKEAYDTFDRYFEDILSDYRLPFKIDLKRGFFTNEKQNRPALGLFREICTFRSAREHNIRNCAEVVLELFAQYVITGGIKFNPLPHSFKFGNRYYSMKDIDENWENLNHMLQHDVPYELDQFFSSAISHAKGCIFVM